MGKELKNKGSSGFLNRVWKWLIGLKPDQTVESLSSEGAYKFYASLGLWLLGLVVLVAVVSFILSSTMVGGEMNRFIGATFGIVVFVFLMKWMSDRYEIYKEDKKHQVNCKFYMEGKNGYLLYNGIRYQVDDFIIEDGELSELLFVLSKKCDDFEYCASVIYYLQDQKAFIKRTEKEYVIGLNRSYKVVSWIAFFSAFVANFVLIIATLIVVL